MCLLARRLSLRWRQPRTWQTRDTLNRSGRGDKNAKMRVRQASSSASIQVVACTRIALRDDLLQTDLDLLETRKCRNTLSMLPRKAVTQ